jgi:hypothetical protein
MPDQQAGDFLDQPLWPREADTGEEKPMSDQLEAGAELDARVAEKVWGWHRGKQLEGGQFWFTKKPPQPGYDPGFPCPYYSTDIALAWKVLEKLRDMWTEATDGASGFDDDFPKPFDDSAFFSSLRRHANRRWPWAFLYVTPLAICHATLAAVEGETATSLATNPGSK